MRLPYTEEAAKNDIRGDVIVRLSIDVEGKVVGTKVVRGLGYGLDELALTLVSELAFEPALDFSDRPIQVDIDWRVHFEPPPSDTKKTR